jgi:hypothetical protein
VRLILAFLTAGVLFSNSLHSAITIYTDRTAWRSAAGGSQLFYVDFNSYTTDVAATGPLDVGPFTLTPNGSWYMPLIDSPQGGFGNRSVGGTSGVTMQALSGVSLLVSFDNAVGSFGFDLADGFGGGRMARITTSTGDFHDFVAHSGTVGFIGLVSSSAFSSVSFSSTSNVRPQIDNFEANAVPEPSALSLLAVGLGSLALVRRRRL